MKSLRNALRKQAGWVWHTRGRAENLNMPFNEEPVTESILLHLAHQFHGSKLAVHAFSKPEESKNGADWEFWFGTHKRSVGLRVQAKRLYPNGNYKLNVNQTQKLITHAGTKLHPVFVFYNDCVQYPRSLIKPYKPECVCNEYRGPSYLGCTMARASVLKNKTKITAAQIATHAFPWHCLLCGSGRTPLSHTIDKNLVDRRETEEKGQAGLKAEKRDEMPASRVGEMPEELKTVYEEVRRKSRIQSEKYLTKYKLAGIAFISEEREK